MTKSSRVWISAAALLLTATAAQSAPDPAGRLAAAIADPARPAREQAADAGRKPAQVLAFLKLAEGQRVLDLVAGGGYYSRLIAPVVGPGGTVFAQSTEGLISVDNLQPGWSVLKRAHPNVRLILGIPGQMKLPERLDRALFHLTFHDLWWVDAQYRIPRMDPAKALRDLNAALVAGGLVLIVDHVASPGAEPFAETLARHRIDPALVKREMTKAGFVLDSESDLLANPADDHLKLVYDPAIRGKTDRFLQVWRKP